MQCGYFSKETGVSSLETRFFFPLIPCLTLKIQASGSWNLHLTGFWMKFEIWDFKSKIDLLSKTERTTYLNNLLFFKEIKSAPCPRIKSELGTLSLRRSAPSHRELPLPTRDLGIISSAHSLDTRLSHSDKPLLYWNPWHAPAQSTYFWQCLETGLYRNGVSQLCPRLLEHSPLQPSPKLGIVQCRSPG